MIVERIETTVVDVPLRRPAANASLVPIRNLGCVLVSLRTSDGAVGESLVFTLRGRHIGMLRALIDSVAELVAGKSADPEYVWNMLWRELYFFGSAGLTLFAISAIDTALWDACGKSANMPLAKMFGRYRDLIPAYASHGLWLGTAIDALAEEAAGIKAAGFRAMKMRIGSPSIDDDVARVAAVRQAIGDDVALMVDASRGLTLAHALRLGRALEPFKLAWYEEPLAPYDHEGTGQVARELDTPIATGENEFSRYAFRALLDARAADVWMMDLARVGGISEMRKIAALAAAHDIPVSNHIFTEHSLAVLGSFANCNYVESIDWFSDLFAEQPELEEGCLRVPDRPGLGFTFDPAAVARFKVG